jgi:hypothetical protein
MKPHTVVQRFQGPVSKVGAAARAEVMHNGSWYFPRHDRLRNHSSLEARHKREFTDENRSHDIRGRSAAAHRKSFGFQPAKLPEMLIFPAFDLNTRLALPHES